MALQRFVWFRPLGRLGEEAIDLFSCRRFIVTWYDPNTGERTEAYYLAPDGRWIEHLGDEFYDAGHTDYLEIYKECARETVAFAILSRRLYGDKLPEGLEEFRRYGDLQEYRKWFAINGGGSNDASLASKKILPIWDGESLMYGDRLCKAFTRRKSNQVVLLDAFEADHWVPRVKDPFGNAGRLKNTVDAMNGWPGSPIAFRQDGRYARWSPKASKHNSSNNA